MRFITLALASLVVSPLAAQAASQDLREQIRQIVREEIHAALAGTHGPASPHGPATSPSFSVVVGEAKGAEAKAIKAAKQKLDSVVMHTGTFEESSPHLFHVIGSDGKEANAFVVDTKGDAKVVQFTTDKLVKLVEGKLAAGKVAAGEPCECVVKCVVECTTKDGKTSSSCCSGQPAAECCQAAKTATAKCEECAKACKECEQQEEECEECCEEEDAAKAKKQGKKEGKKGKKGKKSKARADDEPAVFDLKIG